MPRVPHTGQYESHAPCCFPGHFLFVFLMIGDVTHINVNHCINMLQLPFLAWHTPVLYCLCIFIS